MVTDLDHNARDLPTRRAEALTLDEPAACPTGSTYYPETYGAPCGGDSCWASSPFPGSTEGTLLGYPNEYYSCKIPATFDTIAGVSRETETDWHATLRVPTEQRLYDSTDALVGKTTWAYNARGQVLTQTAIDPATSASRSTTFTYCEAGEVPSSACPLVGLLKSVDGPRTDVTDTTTYAYRAADAGGCPTGPGACDFRQGDLWKVTNALGQVTEILTYDGAGRVRSVKDPNGVVTDLEYQARGWLTASKVRGPNGASETDDQITRLDYFPTGRVQKVTQPDGAFLTFAYDAAQRLTGVSDNLGNTLTYTLDDNGNRIQEDTTDGAAVLLRTLSRVYDQLGTLQAVQDADQNATEFEYAADGSVDTVTDALGRVNDLDHDALGRLRQSIANLGGAPGETAETLFEYDAHDNLVEVTDPKGLVTGYGYNGLGDLLLLDSPDTGETSYGYDAAGNRTGQLDARGIQTGYGYDALGRLTGIDLPTVGEDIAFTYDTAPTACPTGETFATGRLATITDGSGNTGYCYDRRGNVARKLQAITGGPASEVAYGYTLANRLDTVTYPSGALVTYQRNAAGQITGITAKLTPIGSPVTVVADVAYLPFGPLTALSFGNGRVLTKAFDQNYGIDAISDNVSGGFELGFSLDDVGNVAGLGERLTGGTIASRTVIHDGLDRLSELKDGATLVQGFGYDATGNRLSKTAGSTINYTIEATSHRLTAVGSQVRVYDDAGNSASIGTQYFVYDDRGRMREVRNGTTHIMSYELNGKGERVAKIDQITPADSVYFVYDEAGHLIGEYEANGDAIKEYVWLDDTLVAVIGDYAGQPIQYLLTDHLGTPRAAVNPASNAIIWRWDLTPTGFGEHAAQNNPDGDATSYTLNLRYPGQYFDTETGLHYNHFRDYDSSNGRYVQSDPIGLSGGISTFAYAGSNPSRYVDPTGLDLVLVGQGGSSGNMFSLAASTWNRANGGRHQVVHVSSGAEAISAMRSYAAANGGIDGMQYFGHSGNYGLLISQGANTQSLYVDWYAQHLAGSGRVADADASFVSEINARWFEKGAKIRLWGCNTGMGPNSFASELARRIQRPVESATGPTVFSGSPTGRPGQGLPSVVPSNYRGSVHLVPQYSNQGFRTFP